MNIKITVEGPLMDGHKITFKAPCDCDIVEKLKVCYIEGNTQKSKLFTMRDSHGNDLTGLGNLFYQGAYVDAVLDPNSGSAYLQNVVTNSYLEGKTTPVDNLESDRADLPLSARQGKLLNDSLKVDRNVGRTNIKLENTNENFVLGENSWYMIVNGICYFQIQFTINASIVSSVNYTPFSLPSSMFGNYLYFNSYNGASVRIASDGVVRVSATSSQTGSHYVVGSYPIR